MWASLLESLCNERLWWLIQQAPHRQEPRAVMGVPRNTINHRWIMIHLLNSNKRQLWFNLLHANGKTSYLLKATSHQLTINLTSKPLLTRRVRVTYLFKMMLMTTSFACNNKIIISRKINVRAHQRSSCVRLLLFSTWTTVSSKA